MISFHVKNTVRGNGNPERRVMDGVILSLSWYHFPKASSALEDLQCREAEQKPQELRYLKCEETFPLISYERE